ncbi:MAG: sulfatase-like hydrolase/transferase [Deltaproteobacteria bacterium]|nr:sulfatase-like hydrolase/transferase [Deltaproteobacteria bacterium]
MRVPSPLPRSGRCAVFAAALALSCGDPAPAPSDPAPAAPTAADRPNFIVITLDTTRQDVLSAYGGDPSATPMIGQLASTGARFGRAYTVTPLTIPAHSSLHTGLVPPRHGVRDNGDAFLSPAALTLAEQLQAAGWATMAAVGAEVTSHHWGFAQGFDAYFDELDATAAEGNRWRVERPATAVMDDALGWIGPQIAERRPFFAWIHVFDAHDPYQPPPPYDTLYATRPYLGELAAIDAQLTRLVGALQQAGVYENTWIIVLADHGEGMGDHGEGTHGLLLYDATTRIPLIVRGPGVKAGHLDTSPVSIVDITPTVLTAAGLPVPADLDGRDLGPQLRGEAGPADRAVYVESLYGWRHYGTAPQRALVDPEHKLIDSTTPQVYARSDRTEAEDLHPTAPQLTDALRSRMDGLAAGFSPLDGIAGEVSLDEARIAQLTALGYVVSEASGQLTDAVPFRGTLRDPDPTDPVLAAADKARGLVRARKLDEALIVVNDALERVPTQGDLLRLRVDLLLHLGRMDEAIAEATRLDAEAPSSQLKLSLAEIWLQRGDPAQAEAQLRAALVIDPYLSPAWRRLLHMRHAEGDLQRLAPLVAEAKARLPEDPGVLVMDGVLAMARDDRPRARALLTQAVGAEPDQPFGHLHLGLLEQREGKLLAAEGQLLEELRLFPRSLPARVALVEIYASQKRYADQLAQLDQIIAAEPKSTALTLHARAQALFNLGRYPEADTAVDTCARAFPTYAGCALLKANTLSKLGRREEALAAFEQAKLLKAAEDARGPAVAPGPPLPGAGRVP